MQLRDFDINLLVTMEAIWSTRNVSAAAKMLNLAQSTVSAALNRLRLSLQDDLFTWSGSEMLPTPLAEALMPEVRRTVESVRALLEAAHGASASAERRLVIATADYVAAMLGAELLARAAASAPKLSFDFVAVKPQFLDKASRPDVDLFILPKDSLRIVGLKRQLLYRDTYVCVGGRHNDSLRNGMSVADFLRLRHIGYSALPRTIYNHETMHWEGAEAEVDYQLTMASYLIFPRIVSFSDAVVIMPKRLALTLSNEWDLKWIDVPLPTPELDIMTFWKPEQDDDVSLAWLRQAVAETTASWST